MLTADELAARKELMLKPVKYPNAMKAHRKAKGLTLADVAVAVGLSLGFVQQCEKGINVPSLPVAARFAVFFAVFYGVSIETLWPCLFAATHPEATNEDHHGAEVQDVGHAAAG